MSKRLTIAAAAMAGALAMPTVADAAMGYTTGSVNLRAGPGTGYARLTTVPAGAAVDVYDCTGWCEVSWNGYDGWIAGSYIDLAGYRSRFEPGRVYGRSYDPVYRYSDRYGRWGDDWDGPRTRYRDRYSYYRPRVYLGLGF